MKRLADIAVFSRDYRITLVVEVKGQKHATDEWAAKLRRNLLAHDMIPPSQYFLLALPDHFYLWKENAEIDLAPADYKAGTKDVLQHYAAAVDLEGLSEFGLGLLVTSWLEILTTSQIAKEDAPELNWVFDSGLYDSIKDGSVRIEAEL
jgi:hypothetical protein